MDPLLGQIDLFPFTFAPRGYAPCDGALLKVGANHSLFSLLGTRFGGDGKTTFALPDLKGKGPEGSEYFIAIQGLFPSRR